MNTYIKKILVTGGTGYIGSACVAQLVDDGYDVTVFDNLEYGFKHNVPSGAKLIVGDLRDYRSIHQTMHKVKPDAVMHFAAYALVGESMQDPLKYFNNNVTGGINLLMAMEEEGCDRIVFSSTCATYGIPKLMPITEETSQQPINPYGQSKLMFEQIIKTMSDIKGLKYTIFRYFNACGADLIHNLGEEHDPETHIIPNVLKAVNGELPNFTLYGDDYNTADGTCIRDYIHIIDLASAHVKAISNDIYGEFNLGTGKGISNKQIAEACQDVSHKKIDVEYAPRRPGDPDELVADPSKANIVLEWKPTHSDLSTILTDAYAFTQQKRK